MLRGVRLRCLAIYSTFGIRKLHPPRACWVGVDRDEDSTTNRHQAEIQPRTTQIKTRSLPSLTRRYPSRLYLLSRWSHQLAARIWGSVFAIPFVTQHSAFDSRAVASREGGSFLLILQNIRVIRGFLRPFSDWTIYGSMWRSHCVHSWL